MISFYLKIQKKILSQTYVCVVTALVICLNIYIFLYPTKVVPPYSVVPVNLYGFCDGYLLMLFIVTFYFSIGIDFHNGMDQLTLVNCGAKYNKYMFKKFLSLLICYVVFYGITYLNIYFHYYFMLDETKVPLRFYKMFFYSFTTNAFIISLSLFLLFLLKDIASSTAIMTFYYFIEEFLWRTKITQKKGILNHIYFYYDCSTYEMMISKLIYLIISIFLLCLTFKLSSGNLK